MPCARIDALCSGGRHREVGLESLVALYLPTLYAEQVHGLEGAHSVNALRQTSGVTFAEWRRVAFSTSVKFTLYR